MLGSSCASQKNFLVWVAWILTEVVKKWALGPGAEWHDQRQMKANFDIGFTIAVKPLSVAKVVRRERRQRGMAA